MSENDNNIFFQNPDTSESIQINIDNKKILIRDVAQILIDKYKLKSPPFFFTIFKENPTENQYLEEDDNLLEISQKKLDPEVPIWWRSSEIDLKILYELRTDRFTKSGYKMDIIGRNTIMLAGIGLLGSEISLHCATIGFKNLMILDYGSVDWYNIYRQPLYDKKNVFKRKVNVGKQKLEAMGGIQVKNLDIEIPNFNSLINEKEKILDIINHIEQYIKKSDVIITSLDTFSARMIIQILALTHNKVLINTAAGLIGGIIQIIRPDQDPCIGCGTFFERSQETGACTLASFGTPKIIAGLCIDILLDIIEKRNLQFNYLKLFPNYKIETKTFHRSDDCPFCGKNGIVSDYKSKNKNKLINWLFDAL